MEVDLQIPSNQVPIYMWEFAQDDNNLTITIDLHEEDPKTFTSNYSKDDNSLKCTLKGAKYPIVDGILHKATDSMDQTIDGNKVVLKLHKVESGNWPYPIESSVAGEADIDFNSAFLKSIQDPEKPESQEKVNNLVKAGFIPAIMYNAKKLIDADDIDKAADLLDNIVFVEHYLPAVLLLGEAYMTKSPGMAVHCLQTGYRLGSKRAAKLLGDLYSPISEYKSNKDADMSLTYYRYGIEDKDPQSMVAAAQLIESGLGPKTNILEPDELYEEAKSIDPTIVIPKRHKEEPKPVEQPKPEPVEEPKPEPQPEPPVVQEPVPEEPTPEPQPEPEPEPPIVQEPLPEEPAPVEEHTSVDTKTLIIAGVAGAAVLVGAIFIITKKLMKK